MIKFIDSVLDRITMYRLVLYYLIFLLGVALILSIFGALPYDPFALLVMVGFSIAACWITNTLFARVFRVPANVESVFISALILPLIITPLASPNDLWFLGWACVLAMASKYVVTIHKKHLFNPVALAVAITYLTIDQTASWWVGNAPMLAFVLIGGLLVVRKIRRFGLVLSFIGAALATTLVFSVIGHDSLIRAMQQTLLYSPLFFFAFVIVTEPLTTPPTRRLQMIYGAIVGVFFAPQIHFGALYMTPELAVLVGNVFSYLVSPKSKLILTLKQKIQVAPDIWDFIFEPDRRVAFASGQYMEWTLGHDDPDSRGNRRYFTIASAPTERDIRLGVKFYQNSSSFKQSLLEMDADTEIVAAQLAGDFTLPRDPRKKLVFIAGGIGITPYRSMLKYLLDTHQRRYITVFYANKTLNDIVYKDVLDRAQQQLGVKTVYMCTDISRLPSTWKGRVGYISPEVIREEVPDYRRCIFYISGPNALVTSVRETLRKMGIKPDHIKTDFFSGLA